MKKEKKINTIRALNELKIKTLISHTEELKIIEASEEQFDDLDEDLENNYYLARTTLRKRFNAINNIIDRIEQDILNGNYEK